MSSKWFCPWCKALWLEGEGNHKIISRPHSSRSRDSEELACPSCSLAIENPPKKDLLFRLSYRFVYKSKTFALHRDAKDGYVNNIQKALHFTKGLDINEGDGDGRTPLHHSVENNHYETTRLLLINGSDANSKDKSGVTSLMLAVSMGKIRIVKLLLNQSNKHWDTILRCHELVSLVSTQVCDLAFSLAQRFIAGSGVIETSVGRFNALSRRL